MFLLISELSIFRVYFARNWPLLSPTSGFVFLSLAMLILGTNILGNLNKDATSQQSLGLAFWQIVIASGIIMFILGWVNLVAVSPRLILLPFGLHELTSLLYRAMSSVTDRRTSLPVKSAPMAPWQFTRRPCPAPVPAR